MLEIFQWSREEVDKLDKIENIKEELADILIYAIMLADYYNLDIDEIIESKLIKNLKKYPNGEKINLKGKIGGKNSECETYCQMGWWKKTIN